MFFDIGAGEVLAVLVVVGGAAFGATALVRSLRRSRA